MNPNELITKADLLDFEKRFYAKISEYISEIIIPSKTPVVDIFLSRKQVMQMFDITENTFQEHLKQGLPFVRVGKRARYNRQEVVSFLKGLNKFNH